MENPYRNMLEMLDFLISENKMQGGLHILPYAISFDNIPMGD